MSSIEMNPQDATATAASPLSGLKARLTGASADPKGDAASWNGLIYLTAFGVLGTIALLIVLMFALN